MLPCPCNVDLLLPTFINYVHSHSNDQGTNCPGDDMTWYWILAQMNPRTIGLSDKWSSSKWSEMVASKYRAVTDLIFLAKVYDHAWVFIRLCSVPAQCMYFLIKMQGLHEGWQTTCMLSMDRKFNKLSSFNITLLSFFCWFIMFGVYRQFVLWKYSKGGLEMDISRLWYFFNNPHLSRPLLAGLKWVSRLVQ